jgi:hypothetical protein
MVRDLPPVPKLRWERETSSMKLPQSVRHSDRPSFRGDG